MPQDSNRYRPDSKAAAPFWRRKSLDQMSQEEWESLCDGCGRCCLVKLEDMDTGELEFTSVACRMLDAERCQCRCYGERHALVDDCVVLDASSIDRLNWLPRTCAYRLVANGRDLHWWHPLVSGDRSTVHAADISVRGRVVSEAEVKAEDLEDYVVDWPNEDPFD